jgi:rubredoxin
MPVLNIHKKIMPQYICDVCQYIYDEEKEEQKWEELPKDWFCPFCSASKSAFKKLKKDA